MFLLLTYLTLFSSVSIVDIEQLNITQVKAFMQLFGNDQIKLKKVMSMVFYSISK